jgi:hypothetical protein
MRPQKGILTFENYTVKIISFIKTGYAKGQHPAGIQGR